MSDLQIPRRYELKYVVDEATASAIRAAISPFCTLDRNSAAAVDRQYPIRSIYLDTPDRALYAAARQGRNERFKVRVRRYAGTDGHVFLEVKRKVDGLIRKTRARVPEADWTLRHRAPPPDATPAEKAFHYAIDRYGLVPTQLMHYEREAWMSVVDDYARVTFDRRILCQRADGWSFEGSASAWLPLDHRDTMQRVRAGVLLELKCMRHIPAWMAHLVERFGLQRTGFSKYCNGVDRLWGRASLSPELARTVSMI